MKKLQFRLMNDFKTFVTCCLLCLASSPVCLAQSWTGSAGDGSWSNGANWNSGTAPANNSSSLFFSSNPGTINIDTGSPYIFGNGTLSSWTVTGPTPFVFSGDAIQFDDPVRIRPGGAGHTFLNDWIMNGFLEVLTASNQTNGEMIIGGNVTGSGDFNIRNVVNITGNYTTSGLVSVSGGVSGGSLIVDGQLSGTGILSLSSATLVGEGLIARDVFAGGGFIGGSQGGGPLSITGNVDVGGNTLNQRTQLSRQLNIDGTLIYRGNSFARNQASAVINGSGDVIVQANANVSHDGTLGGGRTLTIESGAAWQGLQTSTGRTDADVISNNGFVGRSVYNGTVTLNDGTIDRGEFNNTVTVNAGTIGNPNANPLVNTFNSLLTIAGDADVDSVAFEGSGTIDVDANLNFIRDNTFSNTINWDISGSTTGTLGNGSANSFLGNNVTLAGGQLNGTSTQYVVAGDLVSTGNSTLNQSITVNGAASISSGTLTIAAGRTLTTDQLILQSGTELVNLGTLGLNDLVLESASLNGNINLTNQLIVRTSGQSIVSGGTTLDVAGLSEIQDGTLRVESTAVLSGIGGLQVQNASALDVQGDVIKDVQVLDGAMLLGVGSINGNLLIQGALGPGNSAGTLTIDGDLDVDDTAMICIELGGTTAGISYDTVHGNDTSSGLLGGTLELALIDGFIPEATDEFFVLEHFQSLSGRFSNTENDRLFFSDGVFQVEYRNDSVRLFNYQLSVVPEPTSAFVLMLFGLGGLARRRRSALKT